MDDWLYDYYHSNKNFHEYVEAYCKSRGKGIFEAFRDAMVVNVAKDYMEREKGVCNDERSEESRGLFEEDKGC